MALVKTDWLEKNIKNIKIIDCSWHMPQTKRNGFEEYKENHIPNAIFFDLDKHSKIDTNLPHMLTDIKSWEEIMNNMGIANNDTIVVYDNSDVISSCRCWYNLIYFGHNPNLVHVLDGGFKKWKKEKKVTNNLKVIPKVSKYSCKENKDLVKNKLQINENIIKKEFIVVDARSRERFEGKVSEPRKGLRSGSIKNSFCLPYSELINEDRTFISKDEILKKFKSLKFDLDENIVFSCGSGITASVLALAYSLINDKYHPTIYDGSWAEYGMI
ncbi:rhodanese-like domain-containing protein [Candidatus Pelagibacter communis]|uniref:rhodanese-like domain-containing protein n=1 Tax=Pelagibacter ubique TaxID=198252 RepID=UPI00094DE36F|nr:rhodanese-like domain-containing protein [Candidatus Pelagibacter ubique]|tara:strand:+ start:431 stop:1243 length:813 start_codon:yes stop_codon:yes gene_type:complete